MLCVGVTTAAFTQMNQHSTKAAPFARAYADMSVSGVIYAILRHASCFKLSLCLCHSTINCKYRRIGASSVLISSTPHACTHKCLSTHHVSHRVIVLRVSLEASATSYQNCQCLRLYCLSVRQLAACTHCYIHVVAVLLTDAQATMCSASKQLGHLTALIARAERLL
jgi:hypothetical protein